MRLSHYALLLAAGICLFLVNLGGPALWDIDEGRNLSCTVEMRESGDWIVPRFNGQLRSHKPVLLYWLQAACFAAFGTNEFAGRLPSALASLLTVLLVYELGRAMFNATTGLLGGLVLASTALFCSAAHFANPDALLLTFTTATLLLVWLGLGGSTGLQCGGRLQPKSEWLAAAGVTTGLAILAKGPVGFLLPAAVVVVFLLWLRQWRTLFARAWIGAFVLCALVALPWYILVALETKSQFISEFFLTQNLGRALEAMDNHSGPAWYYVVVLMLGLGPWAAFMGSAAWYGVRSAFDGAAPLTTAARDTDVAGQAGEVVPCYRFLCCWIVVYLLAFTVAATKLPNYILPIFPPFALLIASFLERWRRGELQVPAWIQPISLATLALVGMITIVGLLITGGAVDVGLLHGHAFPGLDHWAFIGLVPLTGAALGGWCLYRGWRTAFVGVVAAAAVSFVAPLAAGACMTLNQFRAPRPLVDQAGALQRNQEIRIGGYHLEFLPSLNFYVQRSVQHQQSEQQALDFMRQPLTVFLFLPRSDWEQLAPRMDMPHRVVAAHREMYRAGEVVVVTNR